MPISIKHALNSKLLKTILAKWSDGLYYEAKVLECNQGRRECLILFEDNTKSWIKADDIHAQLDPDLDEDLIACCICDDGSSKAPNQILLCDCCEQGYHMQCHKPNLTDEFVEDDKDWTCATCLELHKINMKQRQSTSRPKSTPKKRGSTSQLENEPKKKRSTPRSSKPKTEKKESTLKPKPKSEKKESTPQPKSETEEKESTPPTKPNKTRVDTPAPAIAMPVNTVAETTVSSSIEEMTPDLIEAAKNVVDNGFGTEVFMGIMIEGQDRKIMTENKPKKRARKINTKTAAA